MCCDNNYIMLCFVRRGAGGHSTGVYKPLRLARAVSAIFVSPPQDNTWSACCTAPRPMSTPTAVAAPCGRGRSANGPRTPQLWNRATRWRRGCSDGRRSARFLGAIPGGWFEVHCTFFLALEVYRSTNRRR